MPRGRATPIVLLLAVAFAALAAWWYFAPQTLPAVVQPMIPAPPGTAPALYKWRDAQGRLHVTDVPPKDRPYQTLRYNPNTNVVPAAGR